MNHLIRIRSWLTRAGIAALLTLILTLAMAGGLTWQAMHAGNARAEEIMQEYAGVLRAVTADELDDLVQGKPEADFLLRQDIATVLYLRRPDSTAGYYTADAYLQKNPTELPSVFERVVDETIGGYTYKTYTFTHSDGRYVKLLMPSSLVTVYESGGQFWWFWVAMPLVTVLIYLGFAFLMGRPVVRALEEQKQFIHEMTHEIRTPLTVIRGNVENMLASPDSTVMQMSETLEQTLEEVEHITTLSQDLLRSVNTAPTRQAKSTSLGDAVHGVLEIYSEIIGESSRTLIANVQEVESNIDPEKIKQLLIILLENAVKYTREGDKIKVSLKRTEHGCMLSVADTGIGIADGDEEKIFDRFYRGENAKNQQGTGLGLSIARNIVQEYGGKIVATHNIPSGLVITATLPDAR